MVMAHAVRFVALLAACVCYIPGHLSLRMNSVSVPALKIRGDEAYLRCYYDVDEGDSLQSVKWYKDGSEFYRYMLRSPEPKYVVSEVPGVTVDEAESGEMYLQLNSLTLLSSGQYRCDVTTENVTLSANSSMLIVAPPESDPVITGLEDSVWVPNGTLFLNCTAGKSHPAAELHWTIHGQVADADLLTPWPTERDQEGLESSKLGLSLPLGPDPLSSEPIEVACQATVRKHFVEEAAQSTSVTDLVYKRESSIKVGNSVNAVQSSSLLTVVLLLLAAALGSRSDM